MSYKSRFKGAYRAAALGLVVVLCMSQGASASVRLGSSNHDGVGLAAPHPRALSGINVLGWGFASPGLTISDGTDVFVDDQLTSSIVEFDASTRSEVRSYGFGYGFGPNVVSMATNGVDLWVSGGADIIEISLATGAVVRNLSYKHDDLPGGASCLIVTGPDLWACGGSNVVEIVTSTGAVLRDLTASSYNFKSSAYSAASDGTHLWVLSANGVNTTGSLTEIDLSSGALVRAENDLAELDNPLGIVADPSRVWITNCEAACGSSAGATGSVTVLSATTGSVETSLSGTSFGFDNPQSISADGVHVWVGNANGRSVTEINESNATLVRVLRASSDEFRQPFVDSDGSHVWVANSGASDVTELDASSGALVTVLSGQTDGLLVPDRIAVDGSQVWVCNDYGAATVSEIDEGTGTFVRSIHIPVRATGDCDVASNGVDVWVIYLGTDNFWEFRASNGSLVRRVSGSKEKFEYPFSIVANSRRVWISDGYRGLYEFSATTGRRLLTVMGPKDGLVDPSGLALLGSRLWVGNQGSNSVAEYNATTGAFEREVRGSAYRFTQSSEVATNGADVFVTGPYEHVVTEF